MTDKEGMKVSKMNLLSSFKKINVPLLATLALLMADCTTTNLVYPDRDGKYRVTKSYKKNDCDTSTSVRSSRNEKNKKDKRSNNPIFLKNEEDHSLFGISSWYGYDFDGKKTASGEIFNSRKLTAAHRSLPLGTIVSVRNLANDKEVKVRINDRGPYINDRILDISEKGAEILDFKERGLTQVSITILQEGKRNQASNKIKYGATYQYYGQGGIDSFPLYEQWMEQGLLLPKSVAREKKGTRYRIQIGSYQDLVNARTVEYLTRKKFNQPVSVERRRSNYVVKVGSFASRRSAEKFAKKISKKGYAVLITR